MVRSGSRNATGPRYARSAAVVQTSAGRPAASAGVTGRHRRGAPAPRVGSGVGPRARKRLGGHPQGADAHARGGSHPVRALATPCVRRVKRRVLCRGVPVSRAPPRVGTVPRPGAWGRTGGHRMHIKLSYTQEAPMAL